MASASAYSPSGVESHVIPPQYAPRGASSRAAMRRIVTTFGAPVTEPHGKSAANNAASDVPSGTSASIVDVICQTVR